MVLKSFVKKIKSFIESVKDFFKLDESSQETNSKVSDVNITHHFVFEKPTTYAEALEILNQSLKYIGSNIEFVVDDLNTIVIEEEEFGDNRFNLNKPNNLGFVDKADIPETVLTTLKNLVDFFSTEADDIIDELYEKAEYRDLKLEKYFTIVNYWLSDKVLSEKDAEDNDESKSEVPEPRTDALVQEIKIQHTYHYESKKRLNDVLMDVDELSKYYSTDITVVTEDSPPYVFDKSTEFSERDKVLKPLLSTRNSIPEAALLMFRSIIDEYWKLLLEYQEEEKTERPEDIEPDDLESSDPFPKDDRTKELKLVRTWLDELFQDKINP